jgi:putative tributyrin esterase
MALLDCHFFSQVLGLVCTMNVILPDPVTSGEGATPPPRSHKYPTLYLLHGMSDDHTTWQRRTSIERYVEPLDLAVVMPAVQRSFYTDMVAGGRYWTFISEEVPALARHYFPLSEVRDQNYVAGVSMGGYGAFKLALTYPERYAAAASLSGALDVIQLARAEEEAGAQELKSIFGAASALARGPNDLFYLAERVVEQRGPRPALYQWCGTEDFLYADNVRFHEHTQRSGLSVTYAEGPGGHEWSCWDEQIQHVLAWLPGVRKRL